MAGFINHSVKYHNQLPDNGTNTHAEIDTHIAIDRDTRHGVENGFVNRTDSTVTFDNSTRTLTIAPAVTSFVFWSGQVEYTKTTNQTRIITDTEGLHFVYFNENGSLTSTTTFSEALITDNALVASIYWDATNNARIIFLDERHGRDWNSQLHLQQHLTEGCKYGSGLAPGNMVVDGDGDTNSHAQISVADGVIWDEDIKYSITDGSPQDLSTTLQAPVLWQSGASGDWRMETATDYIVTTGASTLAEWNEYTGGAWQKTECTSSNFVLSHVFSTLDLDHPIFIIMGQAEYATRNLARQGATTELLNLSVGGLSTLAAEWHPVATFIIQTKSSYANAVKSRVRSTDTGDDYVDWRGATLASGGGVSATDHDTLLNSGSVSHADLDTFYGYGGFSAGDFEDDFDDSDIHTNWTQSNGEPDEITISEDTALKFTFSGSQANPAEAYLEYAIPANLQHRPFTVECYVELGAGTHDDTNLVVDLIGTASDSSECFLELGENRDDGLYRIIGNDSGGAVQLVTTGADNLWLRIRKGIDTIYSDYHVGNSSADPNGNDLWMNHATLASRPVVPVASPPHNYPLKVESIRVKARTWDNTPAVVCEVKYFKLRFF